MYIESVRASVDILPLCVPLCVLRCFAHWVCGCANCVRCFEKQNKTIKIVLKQSRKTVMWCVFVDTRGSVSVCVRACLRNK